MTADADVLPFNRCNHCHARPGWLYTGKICLETRPDTETWVPCFGCNPDGARPMRALAPLLLEVEPGDVFADALAAHRAHQDRMVAYVDDEGIMATDEERDAYDLEQLNLKVTADPCRSCGAGEGEDCRPSAEPMTGDGVKAHACRWAAER